MAFRLSSDRLVDRGVQKFVTFRCAEGLAQIRRVVLSETHVERARAGDTDPVAGFTEIVREWRDKSQPTTGFLHTNIPRRPPGAVVDVLKRITIGQPCSHDGEWQGLLKTRFIRNGNGHVRDPRTTHA